MNKMTHNSGALKALYGRHEDKTKKITYKKARALGLLKDDGRLELTALFKTTRIDDSKCESIGIFVDKNFKFKQQDGFYLHDNGNVDLLTLKTIPSSSIIDIAVARTEDITKAEYDKLIKKITYGESWG